MKHTILNGDCQDVLKTLEANTIDAILTDPPYGLNMAGWDHSVPPKEIWEEVLRVLKPGGHMLAFGGTRTFHRLTCAIEDAGFEIRDCIMWTHGMGFPKGSNLKPAWEPVILARKKGSGKLNIDKTRVPFAGEKDKQTTDWHNERVRPNSGGFADEYVGGIEKTYKRHTNGKLNIDDCRVPASKEDMEQVKKFWQYGKASWEGEQYSGGPKRPARSECDPIDAPEHIDSGRHPANLIHDGSDVVLKGFPEAGNKWNKNYGTEDYNGRQYDGGVFGGGGYDGENTYCDSGSAARFFYCAKATPEEREAAKGHPTIKPLKLMRYLVKLISNEGELVLDPFMGSGSSVVAARLESRDAIGIDIDQAYCDTALARCDAAMGGTLIDVFDDS